MSAPPTFPGWEAQPVTSVETIDPAPVAALSALLDSGAPAPGVREALPPLWHWVALPTWPASSLISSDGHPRRGDFLPPIAMPRRMFAGGEVVFHSDLRVGSRVRREARVVAIEEKLGRSGRMVIVQVSTRLLDEDDGVLLLCERQDLIYREAAQARPAPDLAPSSTESVLEQVGAPLSRNGDGWLFTTDPTLLMRFSAATANAHRIHYDWPYATQVEGYPGLVVHGPLSTIALAEVLRIDEPRTPVKLTHRNTAPLFCGAVARISLSRAHPHRADVVLQGDDLQIATLTADLAPDTLEGTTHD